MSLGLIMNLLGGGKSTQAAAPTTTNTSANNSNLNVNNLMSAFNSAYQAGMNAGRGQGGYTGGNANANANTNVNIGLYGGGYMVPSLVNNVYGDNGYQQGSQSSNGDHTHTDSYGVQTFHHAHDTQGQGNSGVQASRPVSMAPVNMQSSYNTSMTPSTVSSSGSMPAVLPGLSLEQTSQLLSGLGMSSPAASAPSASTSQGGGGLLGGLLGGGEGGGGLLSGLGGMVTGILGGILGKDGLLGPLGGIVGMPLGLFSGLVGHDSAGKAAANGDVMGWLVNTLDHTGHSHDMGGAAGGGSSAPLGIVGTLGQELGGMVGLDKLFGSAQAYDKQNGTNYAAGGSPNYGSGGLGGLLGGGGAHSGHGAAATQQSAGNGGLLGGLLGGGQGGGQGGGGLLGSLLNFI